MQSVLQENKECFFCNTTQNLECHHIFGGTSNRKNSEKYGLKVWLCNRHHTGSKDSVHHNKKMSDELKRIGQQAFERNGTRQEFMKIFGRNYL